MYKSFYRDYVTHSYTYANVNSAGSDFSTDAFKDILEKCYNDVILHFNTNANENLLVIYFINASSNNVLFIRIVDDTFTGTKYGDYYQYSNTGIMSSQIMFTATLSGTKYVLSDLQYRSNQRNLVALGARNTIEYTPSQDYNPATKKYVDDAIATNVTTMLNGSY